MTVIICKIEHPDTENILITYKSSKTSNKTYLLCKIDGSDIEDLSHLLIYRQAVNKVNKLNLSLKLESFLFKKF